MNYAKTLEQHQQQAHNLNWLRFSYESLLYILPKKVMTAHVQVQGTPGPYQTTISLHKSWVLGLCKSFFQLVYYFVYTRLAATGDRILKIAQGVMKTLFNDASILKSYAKHLQVRMMIFFLHGAPTLSQALVTLYCTYREFTLIDSLRVFSISVIITVSN